MRLQNDDETAQVDAEWFGPDGVDLPWRARYSAYAIGAGLFFAILIGLRKLGYPFGIPVLVVTLTATILLTRFVGRFITYEVPFKALRRIVRLELTAPRPATVTHHARLTPGLIPVKEAHAPRPS